MADSYYDDPAFYKTAFVELIDSCARLGHISIGFRDELEEIMIGDAGPGVPFDILGDYLLESGIKLEGKEADLFRVLSRVMPYEDANLVLSV